MNGTEMDQFSGNKVCYQGIELNRMLIIYWNYCIIIIISSISIIVYCITLSYDCTMYHKVKNSD